MPIVVPTEVHCCIRRSKIKMAFSVLHCFEFVFHLPQHNQSHVVESHKLVTEKNKMNTMLATNIARCESLVRQKRQHSATNKVENRIAAGGVRWQ